MVAAAVIGGAVVGGIGSAVSGKKAAKSAEKAGQLQADSSLEAAKIAAQGQTDSLNYLKEVEALPRQLREGALGRMAGLVGLPGGTGSQQEEIDRARASPLYTAITGGRKAGEEAIMRNAATTGGLRSGNVQQNMYEYNTELDNQALLEAYNQNQSVLGGLSGLPSYATQIADVQTGIGSTQAAGVNAAGAARAGSKLAQGQAWQDAAQGVGNAVTGGVNNYLLYKGY